MDLMPGARSQSTGQLPVSFNSVGAAVVTVAAISYMATTGLGVSRVSLGRGGDSLGTSPLTGKFIRLHQRSFLRASPFLRLVPPGTWPEPLQNQLLHPLDRGSQNSQGIAGNRRPSRKRRLRVPRSGRGKQSFRGSPKGRGALRAEASLRLLWLHSLANGLVLFLPLQLLRSESDRLR